MNGEHIPFAKIASGSSAGFSFSMGGGAGEYVYHGINNGNPLAFGKNSAGAALVHIVEEIVGPGVSSVSALDVTHFPGGTVDNTLPYLRGADLALGATTAFQLVAPITQGYGTAHPVYAMHFDARDEQTLPFAPASGYQFTIENSDEQAFKSFSIPFPLPGGQSDFEIRFGDKSVRVSSGEEIDFAAFSPEGVGAFSLLGVNLNELVNANLPPQFVHSFKFMREGTAVVSEIGLPVPEPSGLLLVLICASGPKFSKRRVA